MMPEINLSIMILAMAIIVRVIFGIVYEDRTIIKHHFLESVIYRDSACEYIEHETYELSKKFDARVYLKRQTGFSSAAEHRGLHQDGIVTAGGKVVIVGQYIGRNNTTDKLFVIDKKAFNAMVKNRPTPKSIDKTARAV